MSKKKYPKISKKRCFVIAKSKWDNTKIIYNVEKKNIVKNRQRMETITEEKVPECKICIDREATIMLYPCGHLCCSTCASGLNKICHKCRQPFKKTIKIYYD